MISGFCKEGDIDLASRLWKKSMVDEACKLYKAMIDYGLSPSEVTRVTLAYGYCTRNDLANAMMLLKPLDKRLWIRTFRTLLRKLCSEKKVGVAALFYQKLLEKDGSPDRVTLAAFTMVRSESGGKNNLVTDLRERESPAK
ncbi:hypothetical protein Bca4012_033635 [Brassica carinata]